MTRGGDGHSPDALDRRIIAATQHGLPLCPRPYAEVAARVGTDEDEVVRRLAAMQAGGGIRRIAAVPQHYALGLRFNAMTVWDVPDTDVDRLGRDVGALEAVSHCYARPRHPPQWPYNLFAMVHGRDRDSVEARIREVAAVLGDHPRASAVLYSRRVLKKTGLRIPEPATNPASDPPPGGRPCSD
ncbi:AsnC family transcriptional regulator [Arhodomonas aquaeolei]|uniref:siroheme decarboxylase subunit beta n=1 Tax=Arhodomonas aquaeolei TaxID=2369 RepID=UPI00216A4077|nr:AsnC family transcriptional regulator [Arhodomonas aquaeolei]MCS4503471.1 AsnC family transcriptional regulator [Arhodomonas aquaeolei]